MSLLNKLDVFYGETSQSLSHVYARVLHDSDLTGLSLSGFIRGPECEGVRTLPSTIPLRDLGPGESLLANAIVPDPSFWSPELPASYRVVVELRQKSEVLETAERTVGIRAFGSRGRSLFLNGQRWVLRAVSCKEPFESDLTDCRDASAAMFIQHPPNSLCEQASRLGVFVVAVISENCVDSACELRRLARWPAVAAAVMESLDVRSDVIQDAAPNIQLAQLVRAGTPAEWARIVIGEVKSPAEFAAQLSQTHLPVVAMRRYDGQLSVAEARAQCDKLQRELAPFGQFAGYIV